MLEEGGEQLEQVEWTEQGGDEAGEERSSKINFYQKFKVHLDSFPKREGRHETVWTGVEKSKIGW